MKSFVIACAVALVLAIIGGYALNEFQTPVDVAFTTTGARI